MAIKVGDKVRFLNAVGGGVVSKIVSKTHVLVTDDEGFDFPTLISECVVIESLTKAERRDAERKETAKTSWPDVKGREEKRERETRRIVPTEFFDDEEDYIPQEEMPNGDMLNVMLGFVPQDAKQPSNTPIDAFLINDSNYYLTYNIMNMGRGLAYSRWQGTIQPNTKTELETIARDQLTEIENLRIQIMAMKPSKAYKPKPAYDMEVRLNSVKFYKAHSYAENDFFDEEAMILPIIEKDLASGEKEEPSAMIERIIKEMETAFHARVSKKSNNIPDIIEIDLHINALLDNTNGMTNKDMLDYQLKTFRETMDANIKRKGQRIVFIHGKGDGVLRKAVLSELKTKYPKCEAQDASFQEYGFGATMVTIK